MGLEQLADANRAMVQHHNTLWDVHLRQTLCDAKHLSQSCRRKSIDFSFCLSTCFHCGIWGRSRTSNRLRPPRPIVQNNQCIHVFLFFFFFSFFFLLSGNLKQDDVKTGSKSEVTSEETALTDTWHLWIMRRLRFVFCFFCLFNVFILWRSF